MSSINYGDLQLKAISLREEMGYSSTVPIDVFGAILAQDKMTLMFNVLSQNIRGMSIQDFGNSFIVINSSYTLGSQRYTAAHELFHLKYQNFEKLFVCNIAENKKPEEVEADAFASYFIMPDRALKTYIEAKLKKKQGPYTLDELINIEQYFGISHEALATRMVLLGYFARDYVEQMRGVKRRALQLGYDVRLYEATGEINTTGYYVRKVVELKEKEEDSETLCDRFLLDAYRQDLVYGNDKESE